MKSTIKLLAFLVAASGVSSAASIVVSNLVDRDFRAFGTDTALNATFTAKIGFLTSEGVTGLSPTSDFASINANWTNAGNIAFASGDAAGYAGYFSGKAIFTDAAGLAGRDVFVWVTNGSTQNAVLRSLTVDFLADSAIPNENAAGIEQTGFATNWQLLLGTLNTNGGNAATGGSIVLNNVPEPSALLLGGLGLLGLVRRRRN